MNPEEYVWLNLACQKGVGSHTLARVMDRFPTLQSLQRAGYDELASERERKPVHRL